MFARMGFGPSFAAGLLPGVPVRPGMGFASAQCRPDQITDDISGECYDTTPTSGILRTAAGPANIIDAPTDYQITSWFQSNKLLAYGGGAVLLLFLLGGRRR